MKKFKKLSFSFILVFFMILSVACNSKSGNSSTYILEKNEGKVTVVLYHNNKDVNKVDLDAKLSEKELGGIPIEVLNQIKQNISIIETAVKTVKGLDVKVNFNNDKIEIDFSVDYTSVDVEQLQSLVKMSGYSFSAEEIKQFRNFEKAEKSLLDAGFVKK